MPHGKRRVSARRGWAGETGGFLSILLENRVGERLTYQRVGNLLPRYCVRTGIDGSADPFDPLFSSGIRLIGECLDSLHLLGPI
jgi:hypothetical protein